LEIGDIRRRARAEAILQARWTQPQASFNGSFDSWAAAKGAYDFIKNKKAAVDLPVLLDAHSQSTQARMAAESVVLLPQDTTTLNYSGLVQTTGLGPLGESKGRGLWLHSLLAFRPDGIPLGVLQAQSWARPQSDEIHDERGRNALSIGDKESLRWISALRVAEATGRRMPQTQLVVMTDREGDLYELHDAAHIGPANVHVLVRAQHDRNLDSHGTLWAFMGGQPRAGTRIVPIPRRRGQSTRNATLELRFAPIGIEAPKVGCKKGWPALAMWAIWVVETDPPPGVEPIEWMLLTDLPIHSLAQAWEKVEWYCRRWGIEEWHRVLKNGCNVEGREFKSAQHLQRALAFDLIVAWRLLACVKLGRAMPQLPATVLYTQDELDVLWAGVQKKQDPPVLLETGR
jgi:hypothetical protein